MCDTQFGYVQRQISPVVGFFKAKSGRTVKPVLPVMGRYGLSMSGSSSAFYFTTVTNSSDSTISKDQGRPSRHMESFITSTLQ